MSSKRFALCGSVVALAIVAGLAAQDVRTNPGPLERRANPVTPENPVPRRVYSVAPAYPAEAQAIDATAMVTLRVTLDEAGRIAEIRAESNPIVVVPPATPSNPVALRSAGDAMVRSAAAALRQWQYDAPAKGPTSFTVTFNFRPGTEVAMTQDNSIRSPGGVVGSVLSAPPPPPPPPPPGGAVRVGGNVMAPQRTRQVAPVYPPVALTARVQGVVILETVIGTDGRVSDVRVLRSIPLLDQAAIDAVKQWEFTPTMLNGAPVPVIMTTTVQFTLPEANQ